MRTLFVLLMAIPTYLASGFLLKTFWEWFIVKTFNLPLLSLPIAIGIFMTISFLTSKPDFEKAEENYKTIEKSFESTCLVLVYIGVCLLFGYITHLFV